MHCIFQSDTNHYYQRLVNLKLSFHILYTEKTKNLWGSCVTVTDSSKANNQYTIYRKRPAFFHRRKCKISLVWRTASGTETSEWNQVRKFSTSSTLLFTEATSHQFVDLILQSFTSYDSVAMELLPCFNVFAFQIFKGFFNCNFRDFLITLH